MRKNESQLINRKTFAIDAINEPKKAAKRLRALAAKLERSKRLYERVEIVAEVLFLSERTVENDVSSSATTT